MLNSAIKSNIQISELMVLLTSLKTFVKPEWTVDFDSIPKVNENYWRLSRKHMKWGNNNALPAITVVVGRWFLDSDGWNNHENQSSASRLLKAQKFHFFQRPKLEFIGCQRWKDPKYHLIHAAHLKDEKTVLYRSWLVWSQKTKQQRGLKRSMKAVFEFWKAIM